MSRGVERWNSQHRTNICHCGSQVVGNSHLAAHLATIVLVCFLQTLGLLSFASVLLRIERLLGILAGEALFRQLHAWFQGFLHAQWHGLLFCFNRCNLEQLRIRRELSHLQCWTKSMRNDCNALFGIMVWVCYIWQACIFHMNMSGNWDQF